MRLPLIPLVYVPKSDISDKHAFDFWDWLSNERAPPPLADKCFLEHKAAQSSIG
jgi:hypothetical protein